MNKQSLIYRAKNQGVAIQSLDGTITIPQTNEEISEAVKLFESDITFDVITKDSVSGYDIVNMMQEGDTLMYGENEECAYVLLLPKYNQDYALELVVRDFFANDGLHPDDLCDDRWQQDLRDHMWDACKSAGIDPCEITCALSWYYIPEHPIYQHWEEDALDTFQKYDIKKHIPFYNN